MDPRAHYATLARYNAWANRRLIDGLAAFDAAAWHADQGLFFKSIHETFNHLLVVERVWLGRVEGKPAGITRLDEPQSADRRGLCELLLAQNAVTERMMAGLPAPLPSRLEYHALDGRPMNMPFAEVLAHVFNHATHHRGQITAVAHRLGSRIQELDLPYFLLEAGL